MTNTEKYALFHAFGDELEKLAAVHVGASGTSRDFLTAAEAAGTTTSKRAALVKSPFLEAMNRTPAASDSLPVNPPMRGSTSFSEELALLKKRKDLPALLGRLKEETRQANPRQVASALKSKMMRLFR